MLLCPQDRTKTGKIGASKNRIIARIVVSSITFSHINLLNNQGGAK